MSPGSPDRSRAPEPGPVKSFDFPAVHRERLDGPDSPELLTARHGDLPLVTVQVVVEGGAAAEPGQRAGIARLTAEALDAGTVSHDEEALAWALESLGVELEAAAGWDAASLAITVHRDRLDPALEMLADVVRRPVFPAGPVDRIRDEQLAGILQRKKQPGALASDAAARFIFAEGVPYARPLMGSEETVRGLGSAELRAFHAERYRAGSTALVVTGGIDPDAALQAVHRHFGDWRGEPAASPDFEVRSHSDTTIIRIVDRPGSVQSEIRLGHVGVERKHPDYFPLLVLNTILGGAFTSRLNMSLRERHGFTYGARSSFDFRRSPGPFTVNVAVATDVTARAVAEAWKEIRLLREDGPTDQEMDSARDYLRGVLPLQLQTTAALASRIAGLFIFDLPTEYFSSFREKIAAVSPEEVRRVAREAVRPHAMSLVIVGDAAQIEQPLRDLGLGEVRVLESSP